MKYFIGVLWVVLLSSCGSSRPLSLPSSTKLQSLANAPVVREYWLAIEPQKWNISPKADMMTGTKVPVPEASFTALRYYAYSPNFKGKLSEAPLLGIMGPVIEANVGDHVVVHVLNKDTFYKRPHSLHVHGLDYSEA